eukprot:CAMPEP_0115133890 /NCGR_PEP_ID=MMETSP0227-20121206/54734_1 /TAXON_ID=89957 /ORGANISM="Polarella glacialis, Strain CCMP 1383" /LENGTH=61 /DNA_ID=CAMNT_0002540193 /DNA_START=44 /DNA_END=225 /DNA_ORIENTATION=-
MALGFGAAEFLVAGLDAHPEAATVQSSGLAALLCLVAPGDGEEQTDREHLEPVLPPATPAA